MTVGDEELETLYRIKIETAASPQEVAAFTELLESHGYHVVTDLKAGNIEARVGEDYEEGRFDLEERIAEAFETLQKETHRQTGYRIRQPGTGGGGGIQSGEGGGAE